MIDHYKPFIPEVQWHVVASFTRQCVRDTLPPSMATARGRLALTARLSAWAWQTAGVPLTREAIFDLGLIERFMAVAYRGSTTRVRHRDSRYLTTMSGALLDFDPARRNLPWGPNKTAPVPLAVYTSADSPWIRSWVAQQRTDTHSRAARAIVGLCRGAGFSPAELMAARGGDLRHGPTGWEVRIRGRRERTIPIDPEWERLAISAFDGVAAGVFLAKPDRTLERTRGKTITSLAFVGRAPALPSLRATWIASLLPILPAMELMTAAGLSSMAALDRIARVLPATSPDQVSAALRRTWAAR